MVAETPGVEFQSWDDFATVVDNARLCYEHLVFRLFAEISDSRTNVSVWQWTAHDQFVQGVIDTSDLEVLGAEVLSQHLLKEKIPGRWATDFNLEIVRAIHRVVRVYSSTLNTYYHYANAHGSLDPMLTQVRDLVQEEVFGFLPKCVHGVARARPMFGGDFLQRFTESNFVRVDNSVRPRAKWERVTTCFLLGALLKGHSAVCQLDGDVLKLIAAHLAHTDRVCIDLTWFG